MGEFMMDSDKTIVYAPVVIPTLCRHKHFIRCIESLRKNPWAQYTEVFVGLDYPLKEAHWEGYKLIDEYLKGEFPEFRAFHVIRRDENVGGARNSGLLSEEALKYYDRFIYMEDDLEVSPNFLEYMDKALAEYENDPEVIGVTGYAYPLDWSMAEDCTVVKQNFNASAWGRGFWRDKGSVFAKYLRSNGLAKDFSYAYKSGRFQRMIDHAVMDYVTLCKDGWSGRSGFLNHSTDVAMRIYLAVKDKYYIMPRISKVRNHGYDGSGLYCPTIEGNMEGEYCVANYQFSAQETDQDFSFTLKEDTQFDLDHNRELLNQFDRVDPGEMDTIWKKADEISRRGRYGGALMAGKKVLKKARRLLIKN